MGLLHEYFAAASDEQAATAAEHGPDRSRLDVVDLPDMDPNIVLVTVEALLVGRDEDQIIAGPRFAKTIGDAGHSWVFTVTDELQQAIATATPERLAEVAGAVVDTADPDDDMFEDDPEFALHALAGLLNDLGDLARRALADGKRVYAWVSL
jgi:hypothetical protein